MSDPKPQPLLTRRPIVCTRCMHGHAVDEISGKGNTPTEYHCVFCGNYAIVGIPAKWPFMVAVKAEKRRSDIGIPASVKSDNNGTSPMQVGEKLRKQEEPMSTFKCKHPGCDKRGAVAGYCNNHFKERYGITAEQYRAEKRGRKEDPMVVAERVREYSLAASKARVDRASETFHAAMEEEKEKHPVTGIPATEPFREVTGQGAIPLIQIYLDPELLEALTVAAKKEYRTAELHAAYLIDQAVRGV